MKVNLGSIDVSDDLRRAVRARIGKPGLATREEVRDHCHLTITADMETVQNDYDNAQKRKEEKEEEKEQ